jgi:TorA maturation chaperone TorD
MTRSESILSRWSRMKLESAEVGKPDGSSELKSIDAERGDLNEVTAGTPAASSPTSPPFDPTSLPPLQSITAGTDIRLYLGSNVPVELTKAALRRTWVTDPAIRDFVGIAENQWDFNDPTAMPGFGPLRANDVSAVAGAQQTLAGLGEAELARGPTKDAVDAEAIPDTRLIDEIDRARAQEYALLAALLSHSPDTQMIEHLSRLSGDTTELGAAHATLSAAAAGAAPEQIEREYFDLFVGLGRGQLFPYASYYLTGYLHGRPLARLRQALKHIGIERTEENSEPEDHAAVLFEVMAGLASGQIIAPRETDRDIFENHIKPWIGRFFSDLEHTKSGTFYASVGTLGRIFMEIEAKAFSRPIASPGFAVNGALSS